MYSRVEPLTYVSTYPDEKVGQNPLKKWDFRQKMGTFPYMETKSPYMDIKCPYFRNEKEGPGQILSQKQGRSLLNRDG